MGEVLSAAHITKSYGERTIIRDINVHLNEQEIVCLLGVSGVGKTTLFHILSGLNLPDSGRVVLNGREITGQPGKIRLPIPPRRPPKTPMPPKRRLT